MDEDLERRIAANQSRFRQVNEAISRGQYPGDVDALGFRCECARFGCNQLVELTLSKYERIRDHSRHFVVVPGHEVEDVERVIETAPTYVIVEKTDLAGEFADATDPRD